MKILYDDKTGKIFARKTDFIWPSWAYYNIIVDGDGKYWVLKPDGSVNVHLPLTLFDLAEDEANKSLCRDILHMKNKVDPDGDQKYSVDKGAIKEKVGWEEEVEFTDVRLKKEN